PPGAVTSLDVLHRGLEPHAVPRGDPRRVRARVPVVEEAPSVPDGRHGVPTSVPGRDRVRPRPEAALRRPRPGLKPPGGAVSAGSYFRSHQAGPERTSS